MTFKERAKKYAPFAGYPIFYLVCLVLFAKWTFPYDKLKDRIVTTFNAEQRKAGGAQELQIGEIGSAFGAAVRLRDVKLVSPSSEPDGKPTETRVEDATVRVSLLSLLVGTTDVTFSAKALGGEVEGEVSSSSKNKSVDVSLEGVDLAQVGPLAQAVGLPIEGKLHGTVKIAMPEGKASKGSGAVSLEAREVAVGDGKAKLRGALALPKVTVGTLTLSADAKDGVVKVTKLAAGGKDVELAGEGKIQLREATADSPVDLYVRFKINDGYRGKNDITKSLFGAPGSSAPALFELDPKVKQSKRADGFFGWHMRGLLGRPDFEPSPTGGGR